MTRTTILIVDDDPQIRDVLRIALVQAGYEVRLAGDGVEALAKAQSEPPPDLMVLDVGLPQMDGLRVCRTLRATSELPIVFLTARDDEIDRVLGLELGGDDYVTKPFSPRELVARIKAILKRTSPQVSPADSGAYSCGALLIDAARHLCAFQNIPIQLTAREMALLTQIMKRPDHVSTRPQLTAAMYGANIHVSDRTVDSHLRNLRSKLAKAGCCDAIETVHGVGVRMGPCRSV
jgi:two-component system OmpR family response regulator